VIASGSGPPRRLVSSPSIAVIWSADRSKSKTSMFSAIRLGLVDFGIAERPCCTPQRSMTWAAVLSWASAMLAITGSSRVLPWLLSRGKGYGNRVATGDARRFKGARYALWKNPDNLTERQRDKLAWIAKTDPRLHRAYLLKEGLRYVFTVKGQAGKIALDRWLSWARRCRITAFVRLARRITTVPKRIHASLDHRLSNALIESVNTKIRLLTRIAFGIRSPDALIALAMLSLGGHRPVLPDPPNPRISQ
jgi:transposase